jgi:predicted nucleic acid-binding protein
MPTILIDTSAIYALLNRLDKRHTIAREFYDHLPGNSNFLVIEYVLAETMTLLRARHLSHVAAQFRERLLTSRIFTLQYSSPELEQATFQIFRSYTDKDWSYADCALFATAQRLAVQQVFTFDHHFDQMQLQRVPSET